MSRRGQVDVAVVGGGVVGATAALALAKTGLDVVLVERAQPPAWTADRPDLRVYAFAPDNAVLLDELGIWSGVAGTRAQPYRHMRVWDAAGAAALAAGELRIDADAFGRRELGWIVEHGLLVERLWAGLAAAGVRVHCPGHVHALQQDADGVRLQLEGGGSIHARVVIAADGAESAVRALAGIQVDRHDYAQRGIVAYVASEQPHAATAWQRFRPGGPLAVLPCVDLSGSADAAGHRSSIVWTLPEADAARLLAVDDASFERELTRALDARLGAMTLRSVRAGFPLQRQLAREYLRGRVLVLGDAAHVVHPLAGQGVNLGLRDVVGLRAAVVAAQARHADWAAPSRLARWARARKSANALAAHAFEGINTVFSSDNIAATLLRGPLLGLAGRIPPLAHLLRQRAAGG